MDGRNAFLGSQYRKRSTEKEIVKKKLKFLLEKFVQAVDHKHQASTKLQTSDVDTAKYVINDNNIDNALAVPGNEGDLAENAEISDDDININSNPAEWSNKIGDFVKTAILKRGA